MQCCVILFLKHLCFLNKQERKHPDAQLGKSTRTVFPLSCDILGSTAEKKIEWDLLKKT